MGTKNVGMKVLQLANYNGPYDGNFIPSLIALEEKLTERGWGQVLAFSESAMEFNWFKRLQKENKHIYLMPDNKSIFEQIKAVNRIVDNEGIRIIHTHFTNYDIAAWLSKLHNLLKNNSIKVIWHVHSPARVKKTLVRQIRDTIKYRIIGRSVFAIVVSGGGLVSMEERGLPKQQALVIPNGIDLQRLTSCTRTRQEVRNCLQVADEDVLCLQFAWDPYIKGADITLNAMEFLNGYGVQAKLCLVGQDALLHFIRGRYKDKIPDWLRTAAPDNDVTSYLRAADIFVSASRTEGFPYAVAEAMAAGLPVVSSDIRGLEWAKEAPGVVFSPSEDYLGLAGGILQIMKWPNEQLAARTAANKSLIAGRYEVKSWAEQIVNFYRQIMGK